VSEEGEGGQPSVVALAGHGGEFEGSSGSENEDGTIEGFGDAVVFG